MTERRAYRFDLAPVFASVVKLVIRLDLSDAVLVVATIVAGWTFRFTQDDAFISMRFAKNLAEGNGLVYNAGERVEGYTNFLWTLFLAIPHALHADPVHWSNVASIVAGVGTVLITARLARTLSGNASVALLTGLCLLAFHTFAIYLTGGLETQWQTFFVICAIWLMSPWLSGHEVTHTAIIAASLAAGLACLTRLDSVVLIAGAFGSALWARRRSGSLRARDAIELAVPAAALLTPWFVWKWTFYGSPVPQTLHAKDTPLLWALIRAGMFLGLFGLLTFFAFIAWGAFKGRAAVTSSPLGRWFITIGGLWLGYLFIVGADFMEFRFVVPVLPLIMIAVIVATATLPHKRQMLVVGLIVFGSAAKWYLFYPAAVGIESARLLNEHVEQPNGYREVGDELRVAFEDLPASQRPSIAITPAGAIAYYSELYSIDMLGLTDPGANDHRWELTKLKAGHEHIATMDHLATRADLIIGGVVIENCGSTTSETALTRLRSMFLAYHVEWTDIPAGSMLYEMPLRSPKCLLLLAPNGPSGAYSQVPDSWKHLPVSSLQSYDR